MSNLTFQYPAWFLLLCVLLGLGYAMLLYYRDTTFKDQSPRVNLGLGVLRFLVVTIISALLLAPLLKSIFTDTKKPIVVLAQDQSESILSDPGAFQLDQYKADWEAVRDALSEDYEVHEIAFGDAVREGVDFEFKDKVSNFSELMQGVYDLYGGQNLGAVVMATDGIYNEGSNPAYAAAAKQMGAVPFYTIALGDTTPRKDLLVKRVFHNKIAYLGDRFSMQVDLSASNCAGSQSVLTVSKVEGDQVRQIHSEPISINKNNFFTTREIILEADKPGVAQYLVRIAPVNGESTKVNNRKEAFIDVLDARQKILILANSPHPDMSALKQMLELNKNYLVETAFMGDAGLDVGNYDFVILHNLPSFTNDISGLMAQLDQKRIPRLFIAGMQANYTALNGLQGLVTMRSDGQQSDDIQATVEPTFSSFTIDPRTADELPRFNPITSAFGTFASTNQAQVILWKRIGKVNTQQPLLAVGEFNGIKSGIFMAEGLWKWRLFDYLQHQNHEIFEEIIGKTIQYLSLKEDKRKFRVTLDQNIFNENEAIQFGAELYNDNYELTNEPDVSMVVRNAEGTDYPYVFNKTGKAYTLNAGILPVGNYSFRATTTFNGKALDYNGKFSVRPVELELFETTANHGVLQQLSDQFGGEMLYAADLSLIPEKIKARGSVKPVIYESAKTNPVINFKWIFLLLAIMLAVEWFLRRYFGAY
ncbi:MAG: hypothetical protein R2792_13565 [Saprospiraceae bacterium]